jgi:hypothetical protein
MDSGSRLIAYYTLSNNESWLVKVIPVASCNWTKSSDLLSSDANSLLRSSKNSSNPPGDVKKMDRTSVSLVLNSACSVSPGITMKHVCTCPMWRANSLLAHRVDLEVDQHAISVRVYFIPNGHGGRARTLLGAIYRRPRGSIASRRPSPIRLKPNTTSIMARPGKMTIWGAERI